MKKYPILKNEVPVLFFSKSTKSHVFNNTSSGDIFIIFDEDNYLSLYMGLYKRKIRFIPTYDDEGNRKIIIW